MRIYEELFILRPDAPEEEVDAYIEQLKALITSSKGNVDKVEKMGVRKLAYRVEKRNEGFYILIQFSTDTTTLVKEIERRMELVCIKSRTGSAAPQAFASRAPHPISTRPVGN